LRQRPTAYLIAPDGEDCRVEIRAGELLAEIEKNKGGGELGVGRREIMR
jgi:hypothetical protein